MAYYFLLTFNFLCLVNGALAQEPVHVPVKVVTGGEPNTCPSEQNTSAGLDELRQNISSVIASLVGLDFSCGSSPGWMRVGYLDMTDPSQSCPPELALHTYSPGLRTCGRPNTSVGCFSIFFSAQGRQYSRICGRMRGYTMGETDGFDPNTRLSIGFEDNYLDGWSLTHGPMGSRTHIWSFASSLSDLFLGNDVPAYCVCAAAIAPVPLPDIVGDDYFCESGININYYSNRDLFHPDDPLWDGQNCGATTCCEFNTPPFFTKSLATSTTDDLELRLCTHYRNNDIPIDQMELYVQ